MVTLFDGAELLQTGRVLVDFWYPDAPFTVLGLKTIGI